MKVVLLAGGFGTRLSEYTSSIPKPMVTIGGKPILFHIMNHYASYGHTDFFIALGYKSEVIKQYFLDFYSINSDFSVDLSTGTVSYHSNKILNWNVTLVDTGLNTMTGGRVKKLAKFLGDEPFLLTYGDGLSDVNINSLINFHHSHGRLLTLTAVRPTARFGELDIIENRVLSFKEKPQLHEGWVNGGFFVIEPPFLNYIKGDHIMLEREPIELAANDGQLMAFHHNGFWQCMDTKRDRDKLESIYTSGPPWNCL